MHRSSLNRNITSLQQRRASIVQEHLYTTFDDDTKVEGLRAVHYACVEGREVHLDNTI